MRERLHFRNIGLDIPVDIIFLEMVWFRVMFRGFVSMQDDVVMCKFALGRHTGGQLMVRVGKVANSGESGVQAVCGRACVSLNEGDALL